MKPTVPRWVAFLITMTLTTTPLTAQLDSPEELAVQYTEAMRAGDWTRMGELMHPDALLELRNLFGPMFDLPSTDGALPALLGVATMDEARALSDIELFAGFMRFIVNQDPNVASALETATVQVLGHVAEATDAHVVVRMTMAVQGVPMTQMDIITVRRSGNGWRGLLAGDLAAVAQAIQNQLAPVPNGGIDD